MLGISLLTKNVTKLLHPLGVDDSLFPWSFMDNSEDKQKSYSTAKNLLISSMKKFSLIDLNLSLSKISFLSHQTAIFE